MDERYKVLKERLSLLTKEELERIRIDIDSVCFDTWNYDAENNKFCPLAVATNLHRTVTNPSNKLIIDILSKRFNPVNAIGGVEGNYYTTDRKQDLLTVINEIIAGEV